MQIGANTRKGAKATDRPFDTQVIPDDFTWHASLFRLEVREGYGVVKE